jgi:acetylornithine deacetylase/succinyl-diaminopimelate desuccinylase-like protein
VTEQAIETYLNENKDRFLEELKDFLRIPSVSADPSHDDDMKHCAKWVRDHLLSLGMETAEIHETDGHPLIYAAHCKHPDKPTVLLYGHYDVQPPDPLELWHSQPFDPTVRDGKIFARGATDDKGQVFAHFKGIESLFKTYGELPINLKIVIEGEEEVGSANLERWVSEHVDLLACDSVVISDSSMFAPGVPSITYGLRGLMYCEVTVVGPSHDLHSGLYGGAVPNPINVLSGMIAKLHDENGHVTIPGFYDRVRELEAEERAAFASLPITDEEFLEEVGAANTQGEAGFSTLERVWARPTLDCNGIFGGFMGKGAKTVIPSQATAKISCRLVPDQDPEEVAKLMEAYLREVAPDSVKVEFTVFHGGKPIVVSRDNPTVQAACRALEKSWGSETVFIRSGGSIPVVATFTELLEVPCVLVGLGLSDDRLHSPNEKFDLDNFFHGILTSAYFYSEM